MTIHKITICRFERKKIMELELKHLAPYLPYGLKILNGWGDKKTLNYTHLDDEGNGFIKHVKPILRPMSDLTKEVAHNGEKFVSLIYLLDLSLNTKWAETDYLKCDYGLNEYWVSFRDKPNILTFGYNKEKLYFYMHSGNNKESVKNQYQLFSKLFEWHFDVFGLIPAGLAIDINTINKKTP